MSENRLSGLIVARFAEDFNISGDESWRMFKEGSAFWRKRMVEHYGTALRAEDTTRYMANPEEIGIDNLTAELAEARAARRNRGGKDSTDYPGGDAATGLPELTPLYTPENPCRNPMVQKRSK